MGQATNELRVLVVARHGMATPYPILCDLRRHASLLAVACSPRTVRTYRRSRIVDAVFPFPELPFDLVPANLDLDSPRSAEDAPTAQQARFIDRVGRLAKAARLNVVVPQNDPEVLVCARFKALLEDHGITAAVSSYESVLASMDKLVAPAHAAAVGMSAPITVSADRSADVASLINELGFPLIVKARFSEGGTGTSLVGDVDQLEQRMQRERTKAGGAIVQEYIRGNREPSVNVILDQSGDVLLIWALRKRRYGRASFSVAIESIEAPPGTPRVIDLCSRLGLLGTVAVQLKEDSSTGNLRFLEANPRWGANCRLFLRMASLRGIPAALMAINVHRGITQSALGVYPPGDIGIGPVDELLAAEMYLRSALSRSAFPSDNPVPPVRDWIRSYASGGKRRVFDYASASLLSDPIAAARILLQTTMTQRTRALERVPFGDLLPSPGKEAGSIDTSY